jgi:hypothetical protein
MQGDGNFVVYGSGSVLWQSRTAGKAPGGRLVLQGDGNLVLYRRDGAAIWNSHTYGTGSAGVLSIQNDQNLVLRNGGKVRWTTNT